MVFGIYNNYQAGKDMRVSIFDCVDRWQSCTCELTFESVFCGRKL